ncbi:acyl esterase [Oleiphilus messinensis]|uniref:Acyl esterase n=1 Tax=Oleiphilus messinensis TaxID=141451 RepID=A0A1Y0I3I9_9GAMM|nr:alpha/beta fold hydrolase [Oleiphilus messinensis]ARU55042.1 acyl esterase [Oleiphilus messinensis]
MKTITHWASATLITTLFSSLAQGNICVELNLPPHEDFTFNDVIDIPSIDGVTIDANLFTPTSEPGPNGFPTIIFVNSWVLEEHEYIVQAAQFAQKGYQVLSYSARGWGCSGGLIDVVGPKDMQDLNAIVDWLQANTAADMDNIGISGISYGSGISLMGLAHEPRIKTAVAMSTWGSLQDSLYNQESPNLVWGGLLVSTGYITGTMNPEITENFGNLITHQNIDETISWAAKRSPGNAVELINERNAPVYLANNFADHLFNVNQIMKFYQQLDVPKRLDINQGTHASGEGFGLIGLNNYTWSNAHDWFDYWLKGEDNGMMARAPVTMLRDLSDQREEYTDLPVPGATATTFYMGPRTWFSQGELRETPYSSWFSINNSIASGLDSGATTGIPLLSPLLDQFKIPVKASIPLINRIHGMVYQTDRLSETMKIRGIPELTLNLSSSGSKMQLIGYLYDVDAWGMGTLITHGPVTLHEATPGKRTSVDFELLAASYDVPEGHRLAVAFDTLDLLYSPPTLAPYSVTFKHSKSFQSTLRIPTVD